MCVLSVTLTFWNGLKIAAIEGMPDNDPDCAVVVAQVAESLRAIKRHVVNFQRQLLLLSDRTQVETTDTAEDCEKER